MPKGVPIKDHLEEPDFKILYATLKHSNLKDTDFSQVAVEMGCKDAAFARALYNRTMKAQGKGGGGAAATKAVAAGKQRTPKKSTTGKRGSGGGAGDNRSDDGDDGHNDHNNHKDAGKSDTTEGSAKKRKISAAASSEVTTEKLDVDDVKVKEEDEMKEESGTETEDGE